MLWVWQGTAILHSYLRKFSKYFSHSKKCSFTKERSNKDLLSKGFICKIIGNSWSIEGINICSVKIILLYFILFQGGVTFPCTWSSITPLRPEKEG